MLALCLKAMYVEYILIAMYSKRVRALFREFFEVLDSFREGRVEIPSWVDRKLLDNPYVKSFYEYDYWCSKFSSLIDTIDDLIDEIIDKRFIDALKYAYGDGRIRLKVVKNSSGKRYVYPVFTVYKTHRDIYLPKSYLKRIKLARRLRKVKRKIKPISEDVCLTRDRLREYISSVYRISL